MTALRSGATPEWCHAFRRLANRAAHEIRNPLNGAAVNVEVLRQRTARPGADTASLTPFAEAAATELARATELVEALLAAARPVCAPVDLCGTLRPLAMLFEAGGGRVTLEHVDSAGVESQVDGDAARLVLAGVLDAATRGSRPVHCTISRRGELVTVRVSGGEPGPVPEDIQVAAAAVGIQVESESDATTLGFPIQQRGGPTSDEIP